MPNAPSSSGTTAQPCILLFEGYNALAVAIASALKRFAPNHTTHVARSLKQAESLAEEYRPELLIIDVDPPWPKLTQLLTKWRSTHSEARVLIMGATIPKELISERGSFGALQFVEKPFDVPEFGAAVQALLGPWKISETENHRGTLQSFNGADAVLLQCASGRTVVLEVKKNGGKTGEIYMIDGQLVHAELGRRTGLDALEEILAWKEPQMREKEQRGPPPPRTIQSPWVTAFLEALPAGGAIEQVTVIPSQKIAPAKPQERTGKKVVVVDDTEMLLIFVEDVLSTADSTLQISTAASGLTGVEEVERVLPDLVLLDYSLPDFNGDEVCRRLLENEQTARVPVLMMSGHVAEMTKVAPLLENVVATIEKPFLSEALVAIVQQTLAAEPRPARKKPPAPKPAAPPAPVTAVPPARQPPLAAKQPPAPPRHEPPPSPKPAAPPAPAAAPPPPPKVPAPSLEPVLASGPFVSLEPPIPQVLSAAPPIQRIPRTGIAPDVSMVAERFGSPQGPTISAPILSGGVNEVVLGFFLEVVSLQLTPSLRMGTIRAKPSSLTASLHVASPALRAALPPNGFQLGPVELDRSGRIAAFRLIPTVQPFLPMETRNAFQIAGVSLVPENSHKLLQLTGTGNAPMRMHLLAQLDLAGVELSSSFQISQLVLKPRTHHVRVTLNAQAVGQEETGTTCEMTMVQLDGAARIVELVLNPLH